MREGLLEKLAAHADMRLKQRIPGADPKTLARIRSSLRRVKLPPGDHHVQIKGGYVILKDIGGHHVVATVLDRHATRLPGRDARSYLEREGKLKVASMAAFSVSFLEKVAAPPPAPPATKPAPPPAPKLAPPSTAARADAARFGAGLSAPTTKPAPAPAPAATLKVTAMKSQPVGMSTEAINQRSQRALADAIASVNREHRIDAQNKSDRLTRIYGAPGRREVGAGPTLKDYGEWGGDALNLVPTPASAFKGAVGLGLKEGAKFIGKKSATILGEKAVTSANQDALSGAGLL